MDEVESVGSEHNKLRKTLLTQEDARAFVSMFCSNHGGINTNDDAKDSAQRFIGLTDKRMVRFIVSELSHNSRGMNDDRARAKIIEWIYSSEARRTVLFMSKTQMILYAEVHLPKSARPKSSTHVGPLTLPRENH